MLAEMIVMGRNGGAQEKLEFRLYAKLILRRQEFCQKKIPDFHSPAGKKEANIAPTVFGSRQSFSNVSGSTRV